MNRRKFFKKLGITTIGSVMAPVVIVNIVKKRPISNYGAIVPKRRRGNALLLNKKGVFPELYKRYGKGKSIFQMYYEMKMNK